MAKYNHKYITFDQLMASVETDLANFADNGLINRGAVIKIVRRVNEDIGLKINKEKSAILDVNNHKADLPGDFMALQLAFALSEQVVKFHKPGDILGTVTEEWNCRKDVPVANLQPNACMINDCGDKYWVTQRFEDKFITFKSVLPVRVRPKSFKFCASGIINNRAKGEIEIEDGYIVTEFEEGKLFINYLADMTDEEGNLLVLDHPLVNDYYEYAVKKALLESWLMNSDADVAQKLVYIKNELREARKLAMSFVDTAEYSDIQKVYQANRNRFYKTYIKMFE